MSETDPETTRGVMGRYADAYLTARAINGLGGGIKAIGIILGMVIGFPSLALIGKEGFGPLVGFAGIGMAGCIATILFVLGTLVAAQGQILKATLDTAVNTSPFLGPGDRASIMSLGPARPQPVTGGSRVSSAATWNCACGRSNHWADVVCPECGAASAS